MKNKRTRLLRNVLIAYTLVICIVGMFVLRSDFQSRWDAHIQDISKTLDSLTARYKEITGEFWRYYLPLVSSSNNESSALDGYFSDSSNEALTPLQQQQLIEALSRFTAYFDQVQWMALKAASRETNYVFLRDNNRGSLVELQESFPFYDMFSSESLLMRVHGSKNVQGQEYFAITAGAPSHDLQSRIMFGFSTSLFDAAVSRSGSGFETLGFHIVEDGEFVYSSIPLQSVWRARDRNVKVVEQDDRRVIVYPAQSSPRHSVVYFTLDYQELFWQTCSEIYHSLIFLIALLVFSVLALFCFNGLLNKEINAIHYGLKRIGDNHLEYRFSQSFHNDGFNEIASAINGMAEELQRTVERSYQFELKQREQEIAELLAKFDPHFLYNTLELFRSRCLLNGDEATAKLITHAAKLFRGMISSRSIVTVQEELVFCEHYLHLFRGRYGEQTRILYDFADDVLHCQIIRNVLQPLIENYFEHGFDGSRTDNYLKLSGRITEKHEICLTVQDNGRGISDERLITLRGQLSDMSVEEGGSYGLKNLHQRIRLYYGEHYGLRLDRNNGTGLSVSIVLPIIQQPPAQLSVVREMRSNEAVKKAIQSMSDS